MKSQQSSSSKEVKKSDALAWDSPLRDLWKGKPTKNCLKLEEAGILALKDLLWIAPLRVKPLPALSDFSALEEGQLFLGRGEVISFKHHPNFRARGKGRALLQNITLVFKDPFSGDLLTAKWFNAYGSMVQKLKSARFVEFMGNVTVYKNQYQVINPKINEITEEEFQNSERQNSLNENLVQYPTINTVSGTHVQKIIEKIPDGLWSKIPESVAEDLLLKRKLMPLAQSFRILHGKQFLENEKRKELQRNATRRLAYEEFLLHQTKMYLRRKQTKKRAAPIIATAGDEPGEYAKVFPYELTADQLQSWSEIARDLRSGGPMMRLLQGDVGSGKTSVAILAALAVVAAGKQVALMAPTESLANQHFRTVSELCKNGQLKKVDLLLGSTPAKERKVILNRLASGETGLVIGTHSLFQDSVSFNDLALAIIDEQHKFGVNQRIRLVEKGEGTHCLIMTATPIPRSLSLTRYGDLDISLIASRPAGRKDIKTRIVTAGTFEKFLIFLNTRISMGEQAYVVVPAITESEDQDIHNLEKIHERFSKFFAQKKVDSLHGQMDAQTKDERLEAFRRGETSVLVSTTVVEVGIDVANATVMAIMNPERFGLSSLHQLRGRVGRGGRPGFCFLVCEGNVSELALRRLRVLEATNDGFVIAEQDLIFRGEGNIFGTEQAGSGERRRFADLTQHQELLYWAKEDVEALFQAPLDGVFQRTVDSLQNDPHVNTTI